jgi:hypothetical protein
MAREIKRTKKVKTTKKTTKTTQTTKKTKKTKKTKEMKRVKKITGIKRAEKTPNKWKLLNALLPSITVTKRMDPPQARSLQGQVKYPHFQRGL